MRKKEKKMAIFSLLLFLTILVSLIQGVTGVRSGGVESGFQSKVLILDLAGTLSFATAKPVLEYLEEAEKNPSIKGILLAINSPGGTVGSSQEIYSYLMKLRNKGIKIVTSMGDVAASGGYYIASASHEIFANPGTLTASIGVIIPGLNFSELLKKLGIQSQAIKSGKMKDALSPFKPADAEDARYMQELVMNSYERFVQDILAGRSEKITEAALRKVADGRVMTGDQAKAAGLIDEIGGLRDAKEEMKKLIGQDVQFISPKKQFFEGMLKELLRGQSNLALLENLQIPLMYFYGGGIQ